MDQPATKCHYTKCQGKREPDFPYCKDCRSCIPLFIQDFVSLYYKQGLATSTAYDVRRFSLGLRWCNQHIELAERQQLELI